MDSIQITLAVVTAAVAGAMTYVTTHTIPPEAPVFTADIFACQQWTEGRDEPGLRLASTHDAPGKLACRHMTN